MAELSLEERLVAHAKEVLKIEAEAVEGLVDQINSEFAEVAKKILASNARVIVCGMGKSGIIARKISSTLASTGTPSFFLHPGEAFHGDLGMLKPDDVLLLISYSGETEEILRLIPFLRENGNTLISMTGNPDSPIGKSADYRLKVRVHREACPLQMAPTSSTAAALAMGDALALALMKERDFKAENFARFHPGGNLGRKLFTKVEEVMITKNLPIVRKTALMKDVIPVMTSSRLGVAVVVDDGGSVTGIITDGDLRRALDKREHILMAEAQEIMTRHPRTVRSGLKLYEAEEFLVKHEINHLLVCDELERLLGIVLFHNLERKFL